MDNDNHEKRPRSAVTGTGRARLRLVVPAAPDRAVEERQHDIRSKEGVHMKALEQLIGTIARFAVGLGIVFALVSAYVIVDTDPGLGPTRAVRAAEVVHLDPVVVTISARRFAEIRAELDGESKLARKPEARKDEG